LTGGNNNVLSESLVGCSDCELSFDCKFVKGKPGKKYSGIHLEEASPSYERHDGSYRGNTVYGVNTFYGGNTVYGSNTVYVGNKVRGGTTYFGNNVVISSGGSARALTSAEEERYTKSGHMRDQTPEEIEQVAEAKTYAKDVRGKKGTREDWEEFRAKVPEEGKLAWSANEGVTEDGRFSELGELGLHEE